MEKHCEVISLSISVGNVGIYLPVDPVVGPYFSEHSFHPMGNEMITEGCHFSRILTIRLKWSCANSVIKGLVPKFWNVGSGNKSQK